MKKTVNRTSGAGQPGRGTPPRQPSRDEVRRRHAQQMKRRRTRRKYIACAAILMLLIAVCTVLCLTVFFKIETITVTGNTRYTQEEIIAASGIQTGKNLFLTNVEKAAAQIESGKPYVRTAQIRRKLPASIEITVEETDTALFAARSGEGYILLDRDLKVLEKGSGDLPEGVAELRLGNVTDAQEGRMIQAENSDATAALQQLLAAADRAGLAGVTYYDVSDPTNMLLTYDGRLDAVVGGTENLEKKMAMLAEVIRRNDETDPQKTGTIDLRVSGKAYLSGKRTIGS